MTPIKTGDIVRLHYTGTLSDGSTFDSSRSRSPLEFKVGSGRVIAGLDAALPGMTLGERKRVEIACADAYGPVRPDMRQTLPRASLPPELALERGVRLQMQRPEGGALTVTVVELDADEVTLDANHPLAGRDLVFDIEVIEIL